MGTTLGSRLFSDAIEGRSVREVRTPLVTGDNPDNLGVPLPFVDPENVSAGMRFDARRMLLAPLEPFPGVNDCSAEGHG